MKVWSLNKMFLNIIENNLIYILKSTPNYVDPKNRSQENGHLSSICIHAYILLIYTYIHNIIYWLYKYGGVLLLINEGLDSCIFAYWTSYNIVIYFDRKDQKYFWFASYINIRYQDSDCQCHWLISWVLTVIDHR